MGSLADDRWHVRMAPGEVKVLTLEQVDDLFRLEMIDGDTLLRQDGTEQWLPLRVVAGLDDEAPPAPFSHSPSFTPPPPSAPVPSAPPPPPVPLPPPSVAPPAVVASVAAPVIASQVLPPVAASVASPVIASVVPLSFTPQALPSRPSRAESLLIGLVVLIGLLVALERNGTLAALCASAGQSAGYARFEASLGGPGFGTPRAVDALVQAGAR